MLFNVILTVHLILCVVLIVLVLLQQGKGADMGAAFGSGASNTLFGAAGAAPLIIKVTTGVAVAFMITSVMLVNAYSTKQSRAVAGGNALAGSVMGGVEKQEPERKATGSEEAKAPAAPESSSQQPAANEQKPAEQKPAEDKPAEQK